jgi:fluoride exporter
MPGPPSNDPPQPTLLLVEDEIWIRIELAQRLRAAGFAVFTAVDGDEALMLLRGSVHVNLLLTDLQMPRMDGTALVKQIRAHFPHMQREKDRYIWKSVVAISVGASLGALLRWWLGVQLNSYFPSIPPGTLAANLIGGYVIGVAIAFFASYSGLAPEWRLLVVTGFCGGLTTFSTYSAELVALLQEGRALWACGAAAMHLAGSVLMTFAGIGTFVCIKSLNA